MRKEVLCGMCAALFLLLAPGVQAYTMDLTAGRGTTDTYNGAIFIEFTEEMQTTVSSGTGVIDPFLTIQKKETEEGFSSDAIPLAPDTARPGWNHSRQISGLGLSPIPDYSSYEEYALGERGIQVSEPASMLLLGIGMISLAGLRKSARK